MRDNELPYAIEKETGRVVSVFEVPNGAKCGCICPNPKCKLELEACQGPLRFYFRHAKKTVDKVGCINSVESAVHAAAKQSLKVGDMFWLPEMSVYRGNRAPAQIIRAGRWITIDDVRVEESQDDIVPDIKITSGEEEFFIEIFVTNKVDDKKKKKLYKHNIPTLEINLKQKYEDSYVELNELHDYLTGKNDLKEWIFIDQKCYQEKELLKKHRKHIAGRSGNLYKVYDCPYEVGFANQRKSVISEEYCEGCPFLADVIFEDGANTGTICCTAEMKVSYKMPELSCEEIKEEIDKEYVLRHPINKRNTVSKLECEKVGSSSNNYQNREYPTPPQRLQNITQNKTVKSDMDVKSINLGECPECRKKGIIGTLRIVKNSFIGCSNYKINGCTYKESFR